MSRKGDHSVNDRAPHCTSRDPWLREAVGAYLLSALEPAENDRVAAHLAGCASCRAEYGELAELLPLLASVSESEAVNGPVRPEPAVLGRVLETTSQQLQRAPEQPQPQPQAQPQRRRWSWSRSRPVRTSVRTRWALAGATAVLVAGGTSAAVVMSSSAGLAAGSWSATAVVASSYDDHINARVDVSPGRQGSKIELKMNNVPAGYSCDMVVIGTAGQHEKTGSWNANAEGSFSIPGWSSLPPDRISSIQIDLPDGTTLLTLTHPR
jgi:anti-sigma factor RsiW